MKDNHIDVFEIKRMLEDKAEKLMTLAEKLTGNGGIPLSETEDALVRDVIIDRATMIFDEALWFYRRGSWKDLDGSMNSIKAYFEFGYDGK
jgi:hypothetical protein